MENENMNYNRCEQQDVNPLYTQPTQPPLTSSIPPEAPVQPVQSFQPEQPVQSPVPEANWNAPQDTQVKKKKSGGKAGIIVLSAIFVLALLAAACSITAAAVSSYWNRQMDVFDQVVDNKMAVIQEKLDKKITAADDQAASPKDYLTPGQVYEQNVQAVVAISNQSLKTNLFGQVSETASSGSGFIISADGYVVTNYHVVSGATTLKVITWDEQEHDATLIGGDANNDLAVLKIEGADLPYVQIGSSDAMAVGDQVAAIGNPLGELTSTLTVGYISATDRAVNTDGSYINMLQTDAAINSGNSGGPLFNMYGEVIGITTAKYSGTSNSGATIEGIGFAIPIDDVADMVDDLVTYGYITGAYLGVMVQDVNAEAANMYGFPLGAYVVDVNVGSCAQEAGIKKKDIITNLGGYDITSIADLTRALRHFEADQKTTISVYRSGQEVHMEITLDEKPVNDQQTQPQQETLPSGNGYSNEGSSVFPPFGFGD